MHRSWFSRLSLTGAVLFALGAQSLFAAVQPRIVGAVSGPGRVALPNSVHREARFATDLGPAPGATKLQNMTLRFSLTQGQQAALSQLLADQQNPSSPRYHQWLTPADYGAQFGLSPTDMAKVTSWLTSQGFAITDAPASNTFVRFSGTVAQADAAFSTSIHNLSRNGNLHYANVTDVSLPSALSGIVSGVTGLHNFKLKPRVQTRTVKSAGPDFTSSLSGAHYIAPGDFYTIYNELPALQNGINGSGVTVAIMGQIDIAASDVAAFRTAAGLSASPFTTKLYGPDPGTGANCSSSSNVNCPTPNLDDQQESSLDLEWAGAAAPGASILFVTSGDVINTSLTDAVNDNLAPIMSISYGQCESSWGSSELNTLNQLFQQANAEGITIVGPGGDDGATDCDYNVTSATNGLAVDFPASSPYVTGLGGSMYNEGSATGGTSYWANSTSPTSGGNTLSAGSDVVNAPYSAAGYIPEAVWNETVAGGSFSAGGGGASKFFSKPLWQTGQGVPDDAARDLPDLAINSAASHDGYLYCVSGSCVNGSFRASDNSSLTVGGGTSFATPSFAGILALVEQHTGSRIGNANPTIYAIGNNNADYNNTAGSVFHDITTGNNDSPCTAGSPDCPSGGSIGYNAGPGYDLATGWGSINISELVNVWNQVNPLGVSASGLAASSTVVAASPTSVAAGATVALSATVSGSQGTPTGTVQFLLNSVKIGPPNTLAGGAATYTYTASCSSLGQSTVSAAYSGDGTYAGSIGAGISVAGSSTVTPVQITVTSGSCPDFSITPSSSSITVTSGNPTVTLSVASLNNLAGTVTFSASSVQSNSTLPTLVFNPASLTLAAGGKATTTLTLSNVTAALHLPTSPAEDRTPWYPAGAGVTVAALAFVLVPRRRKRLGALLMVALAFGIAAGASGCGKNNTTVNPATVQTGTYTVTVNATTSSGSSSISHTATINFLVE